jgi:hypothetical protein
LTDPSEEETKNLKFDGKDYPHVNKARCRNRSDSFWLGLSVSSERWRGNSRPASRQILRFSKN